MTNKQANESSKNQTWLEKIQSSILMPNSLSQFLNLVNLAVKKGKINPESRDMIKGVINVGSLSVRDIMIPRTQIATIHVGMNSNEIIQQVITSSHTRLPLFSENREDVLGILHTKDLIEIIVEHKNLEIRHLKTVLRPAIFIPESKKLDALLRNFKSSHNHLAIVVDEYGVISGLVTIEDILEEIVGDIEDEFDEEDQQITKVNDKEFTVDALTELEDFNNYFECKINNSEVDTIGGLIVQELKHLPEVGEKIILNGFNFQVVAADKRRIHLLRVMKNS